MNPPNRITRIMYFLIVKVILLHSSANGYNLDTRFPITYQSTPGNYFGFSVALHRNREGSMVLVGAPRANSTILRDQLYQPGVLYRCGIFQNTSCREVVLDRRGNTRTGYDVNSYFDKKDDMWLGVSLDTQQNSARNDIVICGHLWKNQIYIGHQFTNGVCYVIDSDLDPRSITKLVPFVDKSKQVVHPGIYYYAFSQLGTSATFSEDGNFLFLGAPGFEDWIGTVVSYSLNPGNKYSQYVNPVIPDPPTDSSQTPESYIGYSVTSGKFYDSKDVFVAVGAPRDGGLYGRVYIFKALKSFASKLVVHQKKEGFQFAEYFGASLLGINLNNDGYDDLLVGAPLFSSESGGDEGKVYVYISNGMGLQLFAEIVGSKKPDARFGTVMANVGDLNQDGFQDVAVGAPHEDGKGAIYIYHGSHTGINKQHVQRISALDIDPSLSGFGIGISRGIDIDNNQFPDVLVGAYASSSAVLFRTQPVIQLSANLRFSPQQINTNVTSCEFKGEKFSCVNVTACLWYAGKHVPHSLEFLNEIFVEPSSQSNLISPRGFFVQKDKTVSFVHQKSNIVIGIEECITKVLYIRPDIQDIITPVPILYRYNLTTVKAKSSTFNKSHPIIDPSSSQNITAPITFETGCGRDNKCLSDLVVRARVLGYAKHAPLIIGKNSTLTMSIEVENLGEPAYLSDLLISLPSEMPFINQDLCSTLNDQQSQRSNASLICNLGNPLRKDRKVSILIKLDASKIPTNRKQINILLGAYTASTEVNPVDNTVNISVNFKAVADISITGSPSDEEIPYDDESVKTKPISITHTYFVMKHGPSPLQIIDIILHIPTSFQGKDSVGDFLILTDLEADSGKSLTIPAKCNDTNLHIIPDVKKTQGKANEKDEDLIVREFENSSEATTELSHDLETPVSSENVKISSRSKRSVDKTIVTSSKKKKDIVINCETAQCTPIHCSASPFSDSKKFAKITVTVAVNMSILNDFLDPWYIIEFVTIGEVFIRDGKKDVQPKNHHPDRTMVTTFIVQPGPPPSEQISEWVIFVSVGAGILLLLIILVLLIKFGFFKRKQKEIMKELMADTDAKRRETSDEDENNDNESLKE